MTSNNNEKKYLMLREEIMYYYNIIHSSRKILYVALPAILTFAFSINEPLLFMLPYSVIIPIYIVTIDYQYGMWRMGTYLLVFLEGKDFNWEKRLHKLNTESTSQINRHASSYNLPFVVTSLCCTILFFLNIDYKNIDYKTISEIIFSIILTIGFLLFIKFQKSPDKIKEAYIQEWKNVKKQKKKNT